MSLYLIFSNEIALGRGDGISWHEDEPIGPKETESPSLFMLYHYRFIWQRFKEHIYLAKEIILTCYYNRNETETVVADQLKQAANDYYPFRNYRIEENYFINTNLQAQGYSSIRPLPKVTIAHYWRILQLFDLCG